MILPEKSSYNKEGLLKSMRRAPKHRVLLITFLIVLFLILDITPLFSWLKEFCCSISSPFQKFFWQEGINTANFFQGLGRADRLEKEIQQLFLQNQRLYNKLLLKESVEKENQQLRKALKIAPKKKWKMVLANIVGGASSQDYILVDKGKDYGVQKGQPVLTDSFSIVGIVADVDNRFSKVNLITSPTVKAEAKIKDKNISGLLVGKGNFKLWLTLVSKNKNLAKGDIVLSGDKQKIFPRNLLIGRVEKVKNVDIEPMQQAIIAPAFNFSYSGPLFIIKEF